MANQSRAPINSPKYADNFPGGYGDFAVQSSDGVIFHFPQFLLSFVSPVFRDMYEMGNNATNSEILKLTEDAETLDLLFQFIDPTKEPPRLIWETVVKFMDAADKYQVNGVLSWFQKEAELEASRKNSIGYPLICFEVAARFNLKDLINLAARDLIKSPKGNLEFSPTVDSRLVSRIYQLRADRTSRLIIEIRDIERYSRKQLANAACHLHSKARFRTNLDSITQDIFDEPSWTYLQGYLAFAAETVECECEQLFIPPRLDREMQELEAQIPTV
jgi:hypothetical protein